MGLVTTDDDVQIFYKDLGAQERPADRFSPWLAAQLRRLGRADAFLLVEGLSRRRA